MNYYKQKGPRQEGPVEKTPRSLAAPIDPFSHRLRGTPGEGAFCQCGGTWQRTRRHFRPVCGFCGRVRSVLELRIVSASDETMLVSYAELLNLVAREQRYAS